MNSETKSLEPTIVAQIQSLQRIVSEMNDAERRGDWATQSAKRIRRNWSYDNLLDMLFQSITHQQSILDREKKILSAVDAGLTHIFHAEGKSANFETMLEMYTDTQHAISIAEDNTRFVVEWSARKMEEAIALITR